MKKGLMWAIAFLSIFMISSCGTSKLTEEEKAARIERQELEFKIAKESLDSMDFIIYAQQMLVSGKKIHTAGVPDNERTNFISVHDGKCIIQLATMKNPGPGLNGLGGLTVDGFARLARRSEDKKGNMSYEFTVTSGIVSCRVSVNLPIRSDRAHVNISGTFRFGSLSLSGPVVPYEPGAYIKGYSLP